MVLCEYVLVPNFYLGTCLNNVLYWVASREEENVKSMTTTSVRQHLHNTVSLIRMLQQLMLVKLWPCMAINILVTITSLKACHRTHTVLRR